MKKIVLFLPLLFLSLSLFGQNSKVFSGVIAFQNGDYEKALEELNTALGNKEKLKASSIPKAYYYRGKAQLSLMTEAAKAQDFSKMESVDLLAVNADFQNALKYDDGKWEEKTKNALEPLRMNLIQLGLTYLNSKVFSEAEKYFLAAADIKDEYMVNDLLGQVEMNTKNYEKALVRFQKSIDLYQKEKPAVPDLLLGYAYYRKALIHNMYSGEYSKMDQMYIPTKEDTDMAFSTVENGRKFLEEEWKRAQSTSMEDYKLATLKKQYQTAAEDLRRYELSLLLNSPEKKEEALHKFEKSIADEPNDYNVHVAYASLLESVDRDKAKAIYKKAIEIDGTKEVAFFNFGSMLFNEAAELMKKANNEDDYDKAGKMETQALALIKESRPYFEKSLENNPESIEAIRALKQITIQMEDVDAYSKYKELEKKLTGG